jgi:hypothetical protein
VTAEPTVGTSQILARLREQGISLTEWQLNGHLRSHPTLRPEVQAGRRRWTESDFERLRKYLARRAEAHS